MRVTILSITCLFFMISGVIRHDVKKKLYMELAESPQFQSVGKVYDGFDLVGSCVLIDENIVLSAAHIFEQTEIIKDTVKLDDGRIIVVSKPGKKWIRHIKNFKVEFNGIIHTLNELIIHPSYLNGSSLEKVDLAIIVLEDPSTKIQPARLYDGNKELGSRVICVGYGAFSHALDDNSDTSGLKIAGENIIDSVGGFKVKSRDTFKDAFLYADFDNPDDNNCCNKMGDSTPLALEYSFTGGDSGGGLFMKDNNDWKLIGINSITVYDQELHKDFGDYGNINQWVRVAANLEWIEKMIR